MRGGKRVGGQKKKLRECKGNERNERKSYMRGEKKGKRKRERKKE